MDTDFDVIIAGGGPGGCSAGLHAARCGLRPLILDKRVFPREKACGDALSSASLAQIAELGLLDRLLDTPHVRINRATYFAPGGMFATVPLAKIDPGLPATSILCRRVILDDMLVQAAKEKMDVLDWCEVREVTPTPAPDGSGTVLVRAVRGGGREMEFTARAVVGADGADSFVARRTGFPRYPLLRKVTANAYFRQVTGTVGQLEIYFLDDLLPGYFWLYPTESGMTNAGLSISLEGMRRRGMRPREALLSAIASPMLKERFEHSVVMGRIAVRVIPTGDTMRRIHMPGVALVGDAAGLIHPCSCEGISHALLSGRLAAESLAQALADNAPWDNRWLRPYPERLWRQLGPALRMADRLLSLRSAKAIESLIASARRRPHNAAWISGILLGSALPSEELDSLLGYLDFFGRKQG
ncbi:MAG: NAD(P)/FAD-dependent oxidoreductase [Thermodesulfobacteriota bacterium]